MAINTETAGVSLRVQKNSRPRVKFSKGKFSQSQRASTGSNNEGSCHCSNAPYHACKSALCTLGIGETAGFVVN